MLKAGSIVYHIKISCFCKNPRAFTIGACFSHIVSYICNKRAPGLISGEAYTQKGFTK